MGLVGPGNPERDMLFVSIVFPSPRLSIQGLTTEESWHYDTLIWVQSTCEYL